MRFRDWPGERRAPNFVQIMENVQRIPWQWLDKRSVKKVWAIQRKSKITETEKLDTGEEQSQEHAHNFVVYQGDCSKGIRPGRPNS
jgi:hypothetical protein